LYSEDKDYFSKSGQPPTSFQKLFKSQLISKAYIIYSKLALERGASQIALMHAKLGVKLLRRTWAIAEKSCIQASRETTSTESEVEKLAEDVSQLNISKTENSTGTTKIQPTCGSGFWALVIPLFHGLMHLSELYAHHGMFQETLYYAQQAHQLVSEAGTTVHMAVASASLGSLFLKAGALDKGSEYLMMAKQAYAPDIKTRETAILAYHLGSMNFLLGDYDAANSAYDDVETILKTITSTEFISGLGNLTDPALALESEVSKVMLSKKSLTRSRAPAKRKPAKCAKTLEAVSASEECPQLMSLRGAVLRQKARPLMLAKDYVNALSLLQEAAESSSTRISCVEQGLATAKQLFLESMEQMSGDPIYSVLQESTISFPAVGSQMKTDKANGDRIFVTRLSPPRKAQATKGRRDQVRTKSPAPNSFFDKLRQAQDTLIEIHSLALLIAPIDLIHTTSTLMNSVAILLSAAGAKVEKPLAHPGFASCSIGMPKSFYAITLTDKIESVRTVALRREHRATTADCEIKPKDNDSGWPSITSSDSRRISLGVPHDMTRFQTDYIDIIPKTWTAISISLSDSRNELSITKLQAGQSPFVLRLPLGRNNSIDADEEVFGFEQGYSELLDIIRLANESAHDARNMHERGARESWWEEREALDARLRDLLENIEKVWLGGFTGIFSQHARRSDLLGRFQKSFTNILDKHLPSRRKSGKRHLNSNTILDPRILELFIGLGDASDEACDLGEPLEDLLYFVVDILQFHGELNAYAEIDFDSIVLDTHDALRAYHAAVRSAGLEDEGRHTILILDKELHAFPWESLPCMDGLAVSRLPSLGCLRDRILCQLENMPEGAAYGQYISRGNGAYVLNPSGDLKSTQTTFQKPLHDLDGWQGITKREPTEEEMKSSLESKDLFLYFGHGSGAQYIRAREIRKLDKCAVTILMGCSSGLLTQAGEFEPYGTPINYMQAGSPALVAVLWDVTDKDIDRFAKSTFEHWGLFEGKGKGTTDGGKSLVEAVAKGRDASHLKYLTAAAVCVYGVPVYFR
jgi:separase